LVDDPNLLDASLPARVALYRLFTQIWAEPHDGRRMPQSDEAPPADTSLWRQAFLLMAVEGLSEDHVARILRIDRGLVQPLIDEGLGAARDQAAIDVLLIHSDTFIAMELEALVE